MEIADINLSCHENLYATILPLDETKVMNGARTLCELILRAQIKYITQSFIF